MVYILNSATKLLTGSSFRNRFLRNHCYIIVMRDLLLQRGCRARKSIPLHPRRFPIKLLTINGKRSKDQTGLSTLAGHGHGKATARQIRLTVTSPHAKSAPCGGDMTPLFPRLPKGNCTCPPFLTAPHHSTPHDRRRRLRPKRLGPKTSRCHLQPTTVPLRDQVCHRDHAPELSVTRENRQKSSVAGQAASAAG